MRRGAKGIHLLYCKLIHLPLSSGNYEYQTVLCEVRHEHVTGKITNIALCYPCINRASRASRASRAGSVMWVGNISSGKEFMKWEYFPVFS